MGKLDTLDKLLDRLGDKTELSDRLIGTQLLGLSYGAVTQWRTRRSFPNDEQCRQLAAHLDLDARYVMAIVHAERAKTPETRNLWHSVAQAFATVLLAVGAGTVPPPSQAASAGPTEANAPVYYVKSRRKPRRDALAGSALVQTCLHTLGLSQTRQIAS